MIVYACKDLIFATKIGSTAQALDVPARPARTPEMLRARLERIDDGKVNDAVSCVMVDLELGEVAFDLIKLAAAWRDGSTGKAQDHSSKSNGGSAGRSEGPRVIAFGPHVMVDALAGAERCGADAAMARGAFTARLPELIAAVG